MQPDRATMDKLTLEPDSRLLSDHEAPLSKMLERAKVKPCEKSIKSAKPSVDYSTRDRRCTHRGKSNSGVRQTLIVVTLSMMLIELYIFAGDCSNSSSSQSTKLQVLNDQHKPPKKCSHTTEVGGAALKFKVQHLFNMPADTKQQFDDDDGDNKDERNHDLDRSKRVAREPMLASDSVKDKSTTTENSKYQPQIYTTLNSLTHHNNTNPNETSTQDDDQDELSPARPLLNEGAADEPPFDDNELSRPQLGLTELKEAFNVSGLVKPIKQHLAEQSLAARQRAMMQFLTNSAPTLSQVVVKWNNKSAIAAANRKRQQQGVKVLPPVIMSTDMKVRSDLLVVKGDGKDQAQVAHEPARVNYTLGLFHPIATTETARRDHLHWNQNDQEKAPLFMPQRLTLNLPDEDTLPVMSFLSPSATIDDEEYRHEQLNYQPITRSPNLELQPDIDRHGDLAAENEEDSHIKRDELQTKHKKKGDSSWLYEKVPTVSLNDLFAHEPANGGHYLTDRLGESGTTKTRTSTGNTSLGLVPLKAQAIRVSANPNTPGGLVVNRRGLITASKSRRPYPLVQHRYQQNEYSQPQWVNNSRKSTYQSQSNNDGYDLAEKAGPPYFVTNARHNNSILSTPTKVKAPELLDPPNSLLSDYEINNSDQLSEVLLPSFGTSSSSSNKKVNSFASFAKEPFELQRFPSTTGKNNSKPQTNLLFSHNPPYKQHLAADQLMGANGGRTTTSAAAAAANNSQGHFLPGNSKWKNHPAHLHQKQNDTDRKSSSIAEQHEQLMTTPSPVYKPGPANATVSPQLNAFQSSNSSASQHLNHPLHHHHNSTTINRPTKIIDRLQHMIIGTILKNTQPPMNLTGLASALQPQWQSPPAPGSQASSNGPSTQLQPTTQSSPAPPLLSSTVANNLASLIAQRLSFFGNKPSTIHQHHFTTPAPAHSTLSNLGSLFSLRYPLGGGSSQHQNHHVGSVQKFKNRVGPLLNSAAHATGLNRRTASMGSILISGLFYGISLLPALMAVTGINPLSAESGGSALEPQASGSNTHNQRHVPRAPSQRQHRNHQQRRPPISRLPGRLPLAGQPGFAYLVPLMPQPPAPSMSPATDIPIEDDAPASSQVANGDSAQQSALKSLYAVPPPSPILGGDILEPEFANHLLDGDEFGSSFLSDQRLNQPPSVAPSAKPFLSLNDQSNPTPLGGHAQASQLVEQYHPYSRYKGHLQYSRPLAPKSTSDWMPTESTSDSWSVSKSDPSRDSIMTGGSMRRNTFAEVASKHPPGLSLKSPNRRSSDGNRVSVSNSTHFKSKLRDKMKRDHKSYRVGYTLNYSPLPSTPPTIPLKVSRGTTSRPKPNGFQSTKETIRPTSSQNLDRLDRVIPKPSGGPRFNLNQGLKMTSSKPKIKT